MKLVLAMITGVPALQLCGGVPNGKVPVKTRKNNVKLLGRPLGTAAGAFVLGTCLLAAPVLPAQADVLAGAAEVYSERELAKAATSAAVQAAVQKEIRDKKVAELEEKDLNSFATKRDIKNEIKPVNDRLDKIDTRLDKIDTRLDGLTLDLKVVQIGVAASALLSALSAFSPTIMTKLDNDKEIELAKLNVKLKELEKAPTKPEEP